MKKDIIFTVPSYFRDDMNIMGYRFGKGEKSCVVLGALRGDEVQQLYVCARLVAFLREVERGQLLGIIIDALRGEKVEEIIAPAAGLVFSQRSYSAVYPGTLLARLCRKERV